MINQDTLDIFDHIGLHTIIIDENTKFPEPITECELDLENPVLNRRPNCPNCED